MVYVLDEGSEFDASLERIWKYVQTDEEHEHRAIKGLGMEMAGENVVLLTEEVTLPNLPTFKQKVKLTMHPPFGLVLEYVEGPLAGSRSFQYYIPKGNKTGVTVVGDFVGSGMDDDSVRRLALGFLELAFNEDNANLRKLVQLA